MLTVLFPRVHKRYSSLPLFGPYLEGFGAWLSERGYPPHLVRQHFRTTRRIDRLLLSDGLQRLVDLTPDLLQAKRPVHSQDDSYLAGCLRLWQSYLEVLELLPGPEPPGPAQVLLSEYGEDLRILRGFARSTVTHHVFTASRFLDHLGYEADPSCLSLLGNADIELFVRKIGQRLSRPSAQHSIAHLRGFLRFLATAGRVQPGLDSQIDTPRVYRGEKLPRALPWETVCALLKSIDRTSPMGLRDYAIFVLITSYGLRACEIVALTLDDLHWRKGEIEIPQRKAGNLLVLPLTEAVGEVLIDYLRRGRPEASRRELFLRCRAPAGLLKPTAVTEAFQGWVRRSGLGIRFQGPHCLRHSYAVHLLRQGVSLKTIGDLLGHKDPESTCAYLRLALEDLREVPLSLPAECLTCDQEVLP
jgi:integrase/recombinase XerD